MLALALHPAAAATEPNAGAWARIGDTGGVGATALARDASDRLYAGTYYKGLFVTANGGTSWSNPQPDAVTAAAISANAVYAGTWGGGVYKSVNAGAQWAAVNAGLQANDVYALVVDPAAANTLYAGTEHGVFKSTNAGGSWQGANSGLGPRFVYALAFLGNALYAGTDRGAYITANGGGSWTPANQGLGAGQVLTLAAGGGKLYAGTDRGVWAWNAAAATWVVPRLAAPPLGGPPGRVVALVVSPTNGSVVAAGGASGVYVSMNGGATWSAFSGGLSGYGLEVAGLALDAGAQPPVLYAATGAGVWRSALELPPLDATYLPVIVRR